MNFVADESVDQPIVTRLREEGHTVLAIVEMEPSISDEAVLAIANQQGMVLLTGDGAITDPTAAAEPNARPSPLVFFLSSSSEHEPRTKRDHERH